MVHAEYSPDQEAWNGLFSSPQLGYGLLPGEYFRGVSFQRGHGIGNVLRSVLQLLLPFGKEIAKEGLVSGSRALTKVLEGEKASDAFRSEGREAAKHILNRAATRLQQSGSGRRKTKRRKVKRRVIVPKKRRTRRLYKKPKKRDILGPL